MNNFSMFRSAMTNAFNFEKARKCQVGDVTYVSLNDIVSVICDTEQPAVYVDRLKKQGVVSECEYYKFKGQGQKMTPIVTSAVAREIIMQLPGKNAKLFRKEAIRVLENYINPTEEFLEDVEDRIRQKQFEKLEQEAQQAADFTDKKHVITIGTRAYNETYLYVRVRYPDNLMQDTRNPKRLTTEVIKFGIAYSLNDRNNAYCREGSDNGYFLYGCQMSSRKDAIMVEQMLRRYFKSVTVNNSREYLNTALLANMLEYEFDSGSYESYLSVAKGLFLFMGRVIDNMWPNKYTGTAFQYNIVGKQVLEDQQQIGDDMKLVALTRTEILFDRVAFQFKSNSISATEASILIKKHESDMAARKEWYKRKITHLESEIKVLENALQKHGIKRPINPVPDANAPRVEKHVPKRVISRDLVTGEERTYSSINNASKFCSIVDDHLKMNYMDKPRQLNGKHWRTEGKPAWVPMDGLICHQHILEHQLRYVKAIRKEDNKVEVYESPMAAADFLNINHRDLLDAIAGNGEMAQRSWSDLADTELGSWTESDTINPPQFSQQETTRMALKNRVPCIARNMDTGEETEYEHAGHMAQAFHVPYNTITRVFLNKPRHFRGMHLRSVNINKVWTPPYKYIWNKEKANASLTVRDRITKLVKVTFPDGQICIYEGVKHVAKELGIHDKKLYQAIEGHVNDIDGKTFAFIPHESISIMTPVDHLDLKEPEDSVHQVNA